MLINVDGEGSGLDTDLLDGHNSDYFATVNHNHNVATQSADGFLSSVDKKKVGVKVKKDDKKRALLIIYTGFSTVL